MAFRPVMDDASSVSSLSILTRTDELQMGHMHGQMNVQTKNDAEASTSDHTHRNGNNFLDSGRSDDVQFSNNASVSQFYTRGTLGGARNYGFDGDDMRSTGAFSKSRTSNDQLHLDTDQTVPKWRYDNSKTESKGGACWWRGLIFLLVVVAFVVVVVLTATVNRPDPEQHGLVIMDPKPPVECPNVEVDLGHKVTFNCTFDFMDANRHMMRDATEVNVESPSIGTVGFGFSYDTPDNSTTKRFLINLIPKMRCSFVGTFTLNFVSNKNESLLSIGVDVNVPQPEARFGVERNQTAENGDTLRLNCSVEESCGNNELGFWGRRTDNGTLPLDTHRVCNGSQDDQSGYTYTCTADYTVESLTEGDIVSVGCTHNGQDGQEMLLTDILSECVDL